MKAKRYASLAFIVILALASFGAISRRQEIYDWARLRNYIPPQEVVALASATTMNDKGRHLFYVNRPTLQDKQSFNQSCTDSEQSIVLGCYIQNQGIYLYDVTDERLKGVEEVTAAHEMLHAAYDRLSAKEKARIDELTRKAYDDSNNQRIKKTIKAYADKDPSVVSNELHSIVGTELRTIPSELEQYYTQYFDNRIAIVDLSEKYEQEFEKRELLATQYRQKLESLRKEVDRLNGELQVRAKELSQDYSKLESSRSSADAAVFNGLANAYNSRVNAYNADVKKVSALIDEHNTLLETYNTVVLEEQELLNAIDSRPSELTSE